MNRIDPLPTVRACGLLLDEVLFRSRRQPGSRLRVVSGEDLARWSRALDALVRRAHASGHSVKSIHRVTGLSRMRICRILAAGGGKELNLSERPLVSTDGSELFRSVR